MTAFRGRERVLGEAMDEREPAAVILSAKREGSLKRNRTRDGACATQEVQGRKLNG